MNFVPYETFEHGADIGVRGYGRTVEEAFQNAAKAMFSLIVENFEDITLEKSFDVSVSAELLDELLVEWLNKLLTLFSIEACVFREFEVKIDGSKLFGKAIGEPINYEKHEFGVEVKGATYSLLKVEKKGNIWIAQCVVDV